MNYRTLPTTFSLVQPNEKKPYYIPIQCKEVYPYFEKQGAPLIQLHGQWKKIRVNDPKLTMRIRDVNALDKLRREVAGITLKDFNDQQMIDHFLPGVENRIGHKAASHGEGMETYEAGVWYRKIIKVKKQSNKIYLFKALSMSCVADLFINDIHIGTHEGSFNPFSFDVTHALLEGENVFALRVHNIPWGSRIDTIPAQSGSDYFNYTGVIHDFWIEEIPMVSVRRVDLVSRSLEEMEATIIIVNKSELDQKLSLNFEVYSTHITHKNLGTDFAKDLIDTSLFKLPTQTIEIKSDSFERVSFLFNTSNLKAWGLLDPHLYVLKTTTAEETLFHEFGVRTLSTNKRSILLNGKAVFLNGMARHEESLDKGRSLSHEDIVSECLELNKMNLNFTRTGHYPNHPLTYRVLDRLGIASMMEVPLWQHENEHFKAQINRRLDQQMWREMIFTQRNRPSVFLWSTQNECNGNDYRLAYNRLLVNDLRKCFDDGRLTTQSAAADRPGYSDPSMDPLDVLGYTLYFGVFHGQPHNTESPYIENAYLGTYDYLKAAHRTHKKPIIVSEYGLWSSAGESVQLAVTLNNLRAFTELRNLNFDGSECEKGFVTGINYWTINDWFVNHNAWIQSMGFKTLERKEKPIVFKLRPLYERLIHPRIGADSDHNLFKGHRYISGPNAVLYLNANGFDASKWAFLVIKADDPMYNEGFELIISDKKGEIQTLHVERMDERMVFHLWMLNPHFLKEMIALTISTTSTDRRIHLRQIDCVNSFKKS
jgi:beta-galactosidase